MPTSSRLRAAHCARGAARSYRTAPEAAKSDRQERRGNPVACLLAFLAVASRDYYGMVDAAHFEELAVKCCGLAARLCVAWRAVGVVHHGFYSVREHERTAALADHAGSFGAAPQTDFL